MNELTLIVGIIVLLLFVLLLIRFVQPQLIYSFRQILAKIEINRAILLIDADDGDRADAMERYRRALIKDIRYETNHHGESYVMRRLKKISELYRIIDHKGLYGDRPHDQDTSAKICIIELANLLDNLGRDLIAVREVNAPKIPSSEILSFLKNEADHLSGVTPLEGEQEDALETWFVENPMSIEQCIELLTAAAWALACRQRNTTLFGQRR